MPKILFTGFSVSNLFFRTNRDAGVQLQGAFGDDLLAYEVAFFNGNGIGQGGNDDDELLYMARLTVSPLGAVAYDETPALAGPQPFLFSIGVNGYLGEVVREGQMLDPTTGLPVDYVIGTERRKVAGADLAVWYYLFAFQMEAYYAVLEPADAGAQMQSAGAYAQLSWQVYHPWLEFAVRGNLLDRNLSDDQGPLQSIEALAVLYGLGNHLKLQVGYSAVADPAAVSAGDRDVVHSLRIQTQVAF